MPWQILNADPFAAHADAWDALQRRGPNTPFLESAFIGPMLEVFGTGREKLALYEDAGGLQAAALLRPLGKGRWETFQPSQLPLGPWISANSDAMKSDLVPALLRQMPGLGLSLGLTQIDPRLNPRPEDTATLRTLDYIRTSWVDVEGDFDTYWNARGKNLRQNARKQRKKLETDGVTLSLDCITEADGVADALADYGRLESTGWKAGTGTAIHPDNDQGRFYRRMLERFCALGRGRIYRYRFDDQVVAMDLCIDNGPMVVVLKTAYDESHRQVSPSTLMREEQFRAWWQEGRYRRIEFYGKTLEWHTRWTEQERTLFHATHYRWGWLQQLAARRATVAAEPD